MSHPLDDCRERVTGAREHLVDITRSVQEFLARNPYRLVQRDAPQTGERVLPVQVREDSPKLATRVGEMAQHLRSALDYLSYQLVLANGETPTNATEFPILLEAQRYRMDAPRRIRGISAEAAAVIERLQPFNSPTPNRHALWVLQELNNADKHRQLSVVGSALQSQQFTITATV